MRETAAIDNIFYDNNKRNLYDNLLVNVKALYEQYPIGEENNGWPNLVSLRQTFFRKIYRNCLIPLKYRRYFWHAARQTNLDLTWFHKFRSYWSSVLGGRPLWGVQDFYFLRNVYRIKATNNRVPDTEDPFVHLEAWQRSELLNQLFHLVFKESVGESLTALQLLFRYKKSVRSLLEFGCATAPVTTTLFDFFKSSEEMQIYISDIQTLAFHYAAYKFRSCSNVQSVLLVPEDDFFPNLDKPLDVIFCLEVFEHLNKPLEIAKVFYKALNHDGLLFFNYIKGKAEGMDTVQGGKERNAVIEYICEHFTVLYGNISKEQSAGLTVVRKKS